MSSASRRFVYDRETGRAVEVSGEAPAGGAAPAGFAREDVHFEAVQMPEWLGKGTAHEAPHYSKDGMPRFANRRQAVEFGKAHGYEYGAL